MSEDIHSQVDCPALLFPIRLLTIVIRRVDGARFEVPADPQRCFANCELSRDGSSGSWIPGRSRVVTNQWTGDTQVEDGDLFGS